MYAQSHLVTSNIINRVVHIRVGDMTGTAFTMEVGGKQYLITARHLLEDTHLGKIFVEHENWIPIDAKVVGIGEQHADVAVLATDIQLTTTHEIEFGTKDIVVSQDVQIPRISIRITHGLC